MPETSIFLVHLTIRTRFQNTSYEGSAKSIKNNDKSKTWKESWLKILEISKHTDCDVQQKLKVTSFFRLRVLHDHAVSWLVKLCCERVFLEPVQLVLVASDL